MSVLLEFSMFPTDRGESVSAEVSEIIRLIRKSGFDYRLTAMGTLVETEHISDALHLVEMAYRTLEDQGCRRVYANLKLDIRTGTENRLSEKIASIEAKIGTVSK